MKLHLAKDSADLKFLYETRTNKLIDCMLSGNPPESYDQHRDYVKKNNGFTRFIYIATERGVRVGYSQLYDIKDSTVEVGFAVAPEHQGKGYGKDLVVSTINTCKEVYPDKTIVLYVKVNNPKARYIYERFGFKTIKTVNDEYYMELLDENTNK